MATMETTGQQGKGQIRCPRCGRTYDRAPKFCLGCGAGMGKPPAARPKPGFPRGPLIAIIASVVVLLMLAGVITVVLVVFNRPPEVDLPQTVSELKSSTGEAQKYLNDNGRSLSSGRAEDAPIYSVSAVLDISPGEGPKRWRPPVVRTQADKGIGVDDCLGHLREHFGMLKEKDLLHERKSKRLHRQIKDLLLEDLAAHLCQKYDLDERIRSSVADISHKNSDPLAKKDELLARILKGA